MDQLFLKYTILCIANIQMMEWETGRRTEEQAHQEEKRQGQFTFEKLHGFYLAPVLSVIIEESVILTQTLLCLKPLLHL